MMGRKLGAKQNAKERSLERGRDDERRETRQRGREQGGCVNERTYRFFIYARACLAKMRERRS